MKGRFILDRLSATQGNWLFLVDCLHKHPSSLDFPMAQRGREENKYQRITNNNVTNNKKHITVIQYCINIV